MVEEFLIQWLAPPTEEPRVVRSQLMAAVALDVAAAQAAIELSIIWRFDDAIQGFRILLQENVLLTRWMQPDGSLSEITRPKTVTTGQPPAVNSQEPDMFAEAA